MSKKKIKLPYHMGSMTKIKPQLGENILKNWLKNFNGNYILSDKLDGISGLCIYKDGNINLYTRGREGKEGTDVSILSSYLIKNKKIPNITDNIVVRGEFIINRENYEKYLEKYPATKHSRNVVGGVILSKNPKPDALKLTDFVVYELIEPKLKIQEQLEFLKRNKFNTVYYEKFNEIDYNIMENFLNKRKIESEYNIDGIIVTDNNLHERNTSKNPKYAFAYKNSENSTMKETKVLDIVWNVSKDGYLKPTVILEPVEIDSVIISKVTAHNAKNVVDNKIGKDSILEIIRSGDVIPFINKIVKSTSPLLPPKDTYKWNDTHVDIISKGENRQQTVKTISYFFKTMGISNLGEKTIEVLTTKYTLPEILDINMDKLMEFDGFKNLKSKKIVESIKNGMNNIELETLMVASNCFGRGIGKTKIKDIIGLYPELKTKIMYGKLLSEKELKEIKNRILKLPGFKETITVKFAEKLNDYITFQNSYPFFK